ncbi:MAG: hypothetical protein AAF449_07705, partial [Myxococcota bacterium]
RIDEEAFIEFLVNLIAVDEKWIPEGDGYAAYLRPTVIATDPYLGVTAPTRCKFFTLMSPVGPYFPNGFDPITVFADSVHVRAWRGGVGGHKVGANYGPTVKPQKDALKEFGTQQVLYCPEGRVTEVGSMNVFAVVGRARAGLDQRSDGDRKHAGPRDARRTRYHQSA